MATKRSSLALLMLAPAILGANLQGSRDRESVDSNVKNRASSTNVEKRHLQGDEVPYVGCFVDGGDSLEFGFLSGDMTVEMCSTHCAEKTAKYMGLQNGFRCLCGAEEVEMYTKSGQGVCGLECRGGGLNCGGPDAYDLYRVVQATGIEDGMCSETVAGVKAESSAACCVAACGQCGGDDCNTIAEAAGLTAVDCCDSIIVENAQACGEAPCVLEETPEEDEAELMSEEMKQAILDMHNGARCIHGAETLAWNATIEETATDHAAMLTMPEFCGSLLGSHLASHGYGENMYLCFGEAGCMADDLDTLYSQWVKNHTDPVSEYDVRAVRMLWNSTTEFACAIDSCVIAEMEMDVEVLVCNYDPNGDYENPGEEVEPASTDNAACMEEYPILADMIPVVEDPPVSGDEEEEEEPVVEEEEEEEEEENEEEEPVIEEEEEDEDEGTPVPDEEEEEEDAPAPAPPAGGDPVPPELQELLDLHNEVRCMHNAPPVVWSNEVSASAKEWGDVLASRCGGLEHSTSEQRNGWGENLQWCATPEGQGTCDHKWTFKGMYWDEVEGRSPGSYGGHAAQILRKDVVRIGAAVTSCDGDHTYCTIQYDPPAWNSEVEAASKSAAECGFDLQPGY